MACRDSLVPARVSHTRDGHRYELKIDDVLQGRLAPEVADRVEKHELAEYVERNMQANHVPEGVKDRVNHFFQRVYEVRHPMSRGTWPHTHACLRAAVVVQHRPPCALKFLCMTAHATPLALHRCSSSPTTCGNPAHYRLLYARCGTS